MPARSQTKLYCYVDETGQDTEGQIFIVSVVITSDKTREKLRRFLKRVEVSSGKRHKKWAKTRPAEREVYIAAVLENTTLAGHLYVSSYADTKAYPDLTILSIAKALHDYRTEPYEVTVLIDGLKQSERFQFAAGLRTLRVRTRKVRGITDQADEFIRLADALAGFVRHAQKGAGPLKNAYKTAINGKVVIEV